MEKEKVMLTLTLPYIELKENHDLFTWTSYQDSGVYFVKNIRGEYNVAEVDMESKNVFVYALPVVIGNTLTENLVSNKIGDAVDSLSNNMASMAELMANQINKSKEELTLLINLLRCNLEDIQEHVSFIKSLNNDISTMDKGVDNVVKGYVSEDALLNIVKAIQ